MRLLEVQDDGSFSLIGPQDCGRSPYAILSHTWGADHEEVTYKDLLEGTGKGKRGYDKLTFCKEQATKDGLRHFWIDTCCINKSSEPELSEAIRSMFKWYLSASKCYVYLSDVSSTGCVQDSVAFPDSRWFTRGWTLQELLAPNYVQFFSKEGVLLGDKHSRVEEISEITNIPTEALTRLSLSEYSIEERMGWARGRKTTREEDQVYSLLGIFEIHIPIMYGEGEDHARKRMKRAIEESSEGPVDSSNSKLIAEEMDRRKKLSDIQNWLSAPDPSVNYHKALKRRQHDTGLWFLKEHRYTSWKTDNTSSIWLYGIPGCGKTILSSTILEDIFNHRETHPGHAVAYFYFDFNDVQKQSNEKMLCSLIVQLLRQAVDIPARLDTLFYGGRPPALEELLQIVRDMTQQFPQIYIMLDALDECGQRLELMEILEVIVGWKFSNLHLIMTSRQEQEIKSSLESFVDPKNIICLENDVVDKDIQLYIRQRLCEDKGLAKWRKDVTLQQEIEAALLKGSKGMFRWAVCQLDTLENCLNRSTLRQALKTLPTTLDKTYERILDNIKEEHAEYAFRILQWLAFSERPLSVDEIAEVVAIDVSRDPEFDRDEVLEEPSDALKICSSLVNTETAGSYKAERIVLAHYSVKEYLTSDRIKRGTAARYYLQTSTCHSFLAMACLGYLNQFQEVDNMITNTTWEYKLAEYSANFWYRHARNSDDRTMEVSQLALRLLSTDNAAYVNWIQMLDFDSTWWKNQVRIGGSMPAPLFYASLFDLPNVVKLLLDQGANVNAHTELYGKALHIASAKGHEEIVKMLVAAGAEVNENGGSYSTALGHALYRKHEDVARTLLKAGASVGPDFLSKGALHHALNSDECTPSLVDMLLELGAPTTTVDADKMTPLHYCVKFGHRAIATQLIRANVPIDVRVHQSEQHATINESATVPELGLEKTTTYPAPENIETGLTPLHYAVLIGGFAMTGGFEMTKFLLEHGADPNALSDYHETPLHVALRQNLLETHILDAWKSTRVITMIPTTWESTVDERVLNALLTDPRISLTLRDRNGESPLHCVKYGKPESVTLIQQMLLRGADPNCCNLEQQSPLHLAAKSGDHASTKLLIDSGANVGLDDNCGLNTLHYAAQSGNHGTIRVILETEEARMANLVASKDKNGKNVLHHLFYTRSRVGVYSVKYLLSQGADTLATDDIGNTPLARALQRPLGIIIEICRLLLDVEGNASFSDSYGRNLGHLYARQTKCHVRMLMLLREHGVDLAKRDCEGQTILHFAARRGFLTEKSLEYLVNVVGLGLTDEDMHGQTALQYIDKNAKCRGPKLAGLEKEGRFRRTLGNYHQRVLTRAHELMAPENKKRKRSCSVESRRSDEDRVES